MSTLHPGVWLQCVGPTGPGSVLVVGANYRCVAVDLVKGEEVVFSGGPLFDALRATMSLPGVFSPLRLGNQILVDGGVLNNLPIDVLRRNFTR